MDKWGDDLGNAYVCLSNFGQQMQDRIGNILQKNRLIYVTKINTFTVSATNVFSKLMSLKFLGEMQDVGLVGCYLNCMKKYFAAVNAIVPFSPLCIDFVTTTAKLN